MHGWWVPGISPCERTFRLRSQMVHVWDHFDYTQDIAWWRAQGWPLLKVDFLRSPVLLNGKLVQGVAGFPPRQTD